ncbi:guanitoxin biosynthesis heme-dependent pre-guanitoxin N-hydroxylase GntA [Profundibacterium mesophilum]|uniref:YqcI/YcgG family protein n=1 Tax=Profundibacterium mesophilum KAUST100406-0324 TaxID=1037889 RepID=A0A921TFX9_9RHOB|nr:guanitoxin biosynthesis heme-dependent pre-guanitoxin N-hydroxylase GntA [Profundibacterium mesophilum]KAF0676889.1 hypothetical protein PMES_00685 [Profundibacterium mesophilum KAUST100406-0324]
MMPEVSVKSAFEDFVQSEAFPCVGAKSALVRDAITLCEAREFDNPGSDLDIYRALARFGSDILDPEGPLVQSFVVVFNGPGEPMEEIAFERQMWNRIQSLHNLDVACGNAWDESTSHDPTSPHFSLSLGGQSYFVIGLHPGASRSARRFSRPALVFNSHEQFERLRADGRYDRMQKVIRERDRALDGEINPMVADFGLGAEAAQYSGRQVDRSWVCPFAKKDVA